MDSSEERLPAPFWWFWTGQLVGQLGDSVYHIGLVWLVVETTGSRLISGFVLSSSYLPVVLFALAAGVIVDRYDRRRIMILCAVLQALLVGMVASGVFSGKLGVVSLLVAAFAVATGVAFFNPARDAIIPLLVPGRKINRANSLVQISAQVAFLAGPALAGMFVDAAGLGWLFLFDALTFLFTAAAIWAIRLPARSCVHYPRQVVMPPELPTPSGSGFSDLKLGLRFAFSDPRIRSLLVITAIDNFIIMGPAILGVPVWVHDVLGGDASDYAYLTAFLFAGMIACSTVLGVWGKNLPKGKAIVVGMILDAVTFLPLYFIDRFWSTALFMFIHGLSVPLITISRATLVHRLVADEWRGRIFSLLNLAVVGFTALSLMAVGPVLQVVGARMLYLLVAIAGGLVGLLAMNARSLVKA
ncbi:MAG: MFS transporter [Deltaproteobacteria bacterium]|nr:MAG: MFS transporter [Deltaproteobacteria bacterium]